ncbi:MAG: LD-carboxypeptidase, partial [bacterium]
YGAFKRYSNKYLDWNEPDNLDKENTNYVENTDTWHFIQGEGIVRGELFGGCSEVLEFLKGTRFWPAEDFWDNKILFFETSEEKPLPEQVKWMLRNYGTQGILNKINAILFGRAKDYTQEEKQELEQVILQVCREFEREDLIVVTNMDFGHTEPQFILPLGINAQIDVDNELVKLIESPWRK